MLRLSHYFSHIGFLFLSQLDCIVIPAPHWLKDPPNGSGSCAHLPLQPPILNNQSNYFKIFSMFYLYISICRSINLYIYVYIYISMYTYTICIIAFFLTYFCMWHISHMVPNVLQTVCTMQSRLEPPYLSVYFDFFIMKILSSPFHYEIWLKSHYVLIFI